MTITNYKSPAAARRAAIIYDRSIAAWPVPVERRTIGTSLGDTFLLAFGDAGAPPLVLLHGSAANSSSWAGDAAEYARYFRVYAVDLPGETGKSTPVRPSYFGSAYSEWLAQVFDGLGIESAAVVGLSLGGWCGTKFAAASPKRVAQLVLLAPGGLAPSKSSFLFRAMLYRPLGMWGIRRICDLVFAPEPTPPGVDEAFAFGLRNYKPRRDNLPLITDSELGRLGMPLLFVGGDGDRLLDTAAGAARIASRAPRATVVELAGHGHALVGTAPRVVEFLVRTADVAAAG